MRPRAECRLTTASSVLLTVKPHATWEEMDGALTGSVQGRQIFAEAVSAAMGVIKTHPRRSKGCLTLASIGQLVSTRTTGARAAFSEAQYRNEELKSIEETMGECAQLLNDVSRYPVQTAAAADGPKLTGRSWRRWRISFWSKISLSSRSSETPSKCTKTLGTAMCRSRGEFGSPGQHVGSGE